MGRKEGRKGVYYGETSGSIHERSPEHMLDAENFSPKSHIMKLWVTEHPEVKLRPPFTLTIVRQYKDCQSRQIDEAIKIQDTPRVHKTLGSWDPGS